MKPAVVDEIKGVAEWEESRQKIAIRLQLYFSKSDIEKQWEDFCKKMRVYEERIISKSDAGPTKEDILTDNKVLKPSLHPSINTESRHLSRIK